MANPRTLAGKLVTAFGRPEEMALLYADNVVWSLPPSLSLGGDYSGRAAVTALNRAVWEVHYHPDTVEVRLLDEFGVRGRSVVRFIYSARMRANERLYSSEYALFAHSRAGLITRVWEMLDTSTAQRIAALPR
jgi:ketosteroid isomerase-like protein